MDSCKYAEIGRAVRNLVVNSTSLKAEENVLIVTDSAQDEIIVNAFALVAAEAGAEVSVAMMTPRTLPGEKNFHGFEGPPKVIAEAMKSADVIYEISTMWIGLSQARFDAIANGCRFVTLPRIAFSALRNNGPCDVDFFKLRPVGEAVRDMFTKAKKLRMLSRGGTDLTATIEGRNGRCMNGIATERGSYAGGCDLEAGTAPIEGTAEGVIVVDGMVEFSCMPVLAEPFQITVKKGRLVDIRGEGSAKPYVEFYRHALEALKNPDAFTLAETSIGLNPNAVMCDVELEAESVLGSGHVAFGYNISYGGKISVPGHFDVVMKDVTVFLDDKKIVDDGKFVAVKMPL